MEPEVAVHLPDGRQSARAIEDRLREHSPGVRVPAGLLSRLYGLEERIVAAVGDLPSTLASHAVGRVLEQAALTPGEIGLLLFAAVSADVEEPANAHIVAVQSGLSCPVFDVTNACNSVLNALEVPVACGDASEAAPVGVAVSAPGVNPRPRMSHRLPNGVLLMRGAGRPRLWSGAVRADRACAGEAR
ncbi:hypothetical protein [Streptomyces sp. BF23-19]|uniref:hypothetical protein n=1 Tax=unclassified Streptomyces TaxID=2593676 RepID=UPI0034E3B4E9